MISSATVLLRSIPSSAAIVDNRGKHWVGKLNTPDAPNCSAGTVRWADTKHVLQKQFQELLLELGMPRRIPPWEGPHRVYLLSMGNTSKSLYLYLWICHLRNIVELDHVADFHQGLFGIKGVRVLNLARFNSGLFPLPVLGRSVIEGRPDLNIKTLKKQWDDSGMRVVSASEVVYCDTLRERQRAQKERTDTKRAKKERAGNNDSLPTKRELPETVDAIAPNKRSKPVPPAASSSESTSAAATLLSLALAQPAVDPAHHRLVRDSLDRAVAAQQAVLDELIAARDAHARLCKD